MQSNFRSSFFNLSPTALNSITALFATTYQRARHNYSSHVRSSLRNDDTSSRRFTFTFTSLDNRANNCKLARETRVQMLSRGRIGDNSRRNRGKTGWKRFLFPGWNSVERNGGAIWSEHRRSERFRSETFLRYKPRQRPPQTRWIENEAWRTVQRVGSTHATRFP